VRKANDWLEQLERAGNRLPDPATLFFTGTLLALMMPYALVFAVAWSLLLGGWVAMGWELGPGGPLFFGR
jgi:p-aminobenzoyl-glutamate transporter AbgT